MSKCICEMVLFILHNTNDGNDLSQEHLYLVQEMANGNCNEYGETEFYKLYDNVKKGYEKPWFHGIKHMTQDHQGYVYWKGKQIEHYSFDNYRKEAKAAAELAQECKLLESQGKEVNHKNLWELW